MTAIQLLNEQAQQTDQFQFGHTLRARVTLSAGHGETKPPVIHLGIVRRDRTTNLRRLVRYGRRRAAPHRSPHLPH